MGAVLAALLIVASLPTVANALIATVSGQMIQISPPASVLPGVTQNATSIVAFNERQGVFLGTPVAVDIVSPGTYDQNSDLVNANVPAGTVVDSHFLHSDRPAGGNTERIGTVTFPTQILGVIVTSGHLNLSDLIGSPTTTYPGGVSNRGLEFGGGIQGDIVVLPDLRTLKLDAQTTSGIDQVRVLTKHNAPPTVNAGGPYAGTEGVGTTLAGTATDSDGDPLTRAWTFTWTGDPGTTCSATNTTTLAPTVTCNDDALVTARLTVNDGVNTAVVSTASVTIGNGAPVLGTIGVPTAPVALATAVNVTAPFTDPGTNDTHTATITWGDTASSAATISETAGAGNATSSHTYASPGFYTVTVTLHDDDLGVVSKTAQVHVDGPPTADAGGPYTGSEGLATGLVGTAVDPENDPLATNWTFTPTAIDPGGSCTSTGTTTLVPSVTCNDDAVVTASLSANDGINPAVVSSTSVTVANELPVVGPVSAPSGTVAAGQTISVSAPFTDAGTNDTHTATVSWGDLTSSPGSVTESGGSGTVAASHTYAAAGLYTITVTVTDDDFGPDISSASVLVNSPPTAAAGGPYVGTEGAELTLSGSASDLDADPLAISWGFTWTGDPGTTCAATGTDTLTPALRCTDDAVVNATMTVSDGVNPAVVKTTTITVSNVGPVISAATPSATLVPTGSPVSVNLSLTDAGENDTHTATVDWGDSNTTAATVTETPGTGTVSASHSYMAPGNYTVTVTVTDDNGGAASSSTSIHVNGSPTAGAGGPYTGIEGAAIPLNGASDDPDHDPVTVSWTRSIVSAPSGTVCNLAGATTLTPTLTCNDQANVDVTISVSDGVNPTVTDTTTVAVTNAAPIVDTPTVTPNPAPLGDAVTVSADFTDAGTNDAHTATISWGDSTTTTGTVNETHGSGSGVVTGSHTYAAPGSYTVTVTVNDGVATDSATSTAVVNGPPTADAGGPYSGFEGTPVVLDASASDPGGDPLSVSWTFSFTGDPGTTCATTGSTTLSPTVSCTDNAVVTATLRVSDGINAPVLSTATIQIANKAPVVTAAVPSSPLVPVGTAVSVGLNFSDAGTNDTHTASIDWGDSTTSSATVTELDGAGSVTDSHVYAVAGNYHVTVTVTDDNGGSASSSTDIAANGAPTVGVGGPYSGVEGAGVTLNGTATDPDADHLTISWTKTIVSAGPGTTCDLTDTSTLTPTLTCDDDAVVSVTISASDGIHPTVVDTTQVTIANAPPTVATPTVTPNPVALGSPVSLSTSFTDPGVHDDHSATIDWGDSSTTNGNVSETPGVGTVTGLHTYAARGTYIVVVTVNDKDGGKTSKSTTVVVSGPPTASAGGPYSGTEGTPKVLAGSASDPDGDPLAIGWTINWAGDPGTTCTATNTSTLTPSITCDDDAVVTATLSVSDGINAPVVRTATLTVANAAPVVTSPPTPSATPVPIGSAVSVSLGFADPGANDTHTASISWGDSSSSAGTVTETAGAGTVSKSHTYATAGVKTVTVTVTDDNGGTVTSTTTIRVNSPPTASAGGPYSGFEGSTLALNGAATDPDANPLTISWTSTIVTAPAGTTCTFTNTTTLTPALSCNDQATVQVTITVNDGFNAPVSDTATVTIANKAPVVGSPTITPNPAAVGAPVTLTASFTDKGKHDTHTATINWGDGTTTTASVTETPGSGTGTVTGSHTYAARGSYTVTVTVNDGVASGSNSTCLTVNGAPNVDTGGPYSGTEGSYIQLHATTSDPDRDPGGVSWTFTKVADPGTTCTTAYTTTLSPKIKCTDDAVVTATLRVNDGINPTVIRTTTITFTNKAPTIGTVSLPTSPVSVGTAVSVQASFADAGLNDTHTASFAWGDSTSSPGSVDEDPGSGIATGTHAYSSPGAYNVTVTITDDDGGVATLVSTKTIVVYATTGAFVTGGGFIDSPSGAYTPANPNDANGQGRANFGFVARSSGGSVTGNTEFQLRLRLPDPPNTSGDDDDDEHNSWRDRDRRSHDDGWDNQRFSTTNLNFHSTSYSTLTVNSGLTQAIFKGTGTVNGASGYSFLVSVIDGRNNGNDKFRIKVWNTSTGEVLYDNQAGAVDTANAITNVSCGSIVIHG
ncbi:MAG: PKD domain-containing protein [Acidimicrobiia bacterium]